MSGTRFQKAKEGSGKKLGRLGSRTERTSTKKATTEASLLKDVEDGDFALPLDRVQTASMRGMLERAMKSVSWQPEPLNPASKPFSVVAPYTEPYDDGEYTLSGSVFHSYAEEHCHHLFLEVGTCPQPCARYVGDMLDLNLFPGNEGLSKDELAKVEEKQEKWDKTAAIDYEKDFTKYRRRQLDGEDEGKEDIMIPPAPRDVTSLDCLAKRSRFDAAEEDQCLCIDPCRRFKTCDECAANKASHMLPPEGVPADTFRPPHWAAVGSPYNCGWCQNKCVSGARSGPSIGGDECAWWRYTVPSCQEMAVRDAQKPVRPQPQCDEKRYSECDPPCKWVGNTRFTGHCIVDPELVAEAEAEGEIEGGDEAPAEDTDAGADA